MSLSLKSIAVVLTAASLAFVPFTTSTAFAATTSTTSVASSTTPVGDDYDPSKIATIIPGKVTCSNRYPSYKIKTGSRSVRVTDASDDLQEYTWYPARQPAHTTKKYVLETQLRYGQVAGTTVTIKNKLGQEVLYDVIFVAPSKKKCGKH